MNYSVHSLVGACRRSCAKLSAAVEIVRPTASFVLTFPMWASHRAAKHLQAIFDFTMRALDSALCGLAVFRVPLLISIFSYVILSQPAQIRELHLDFAESTADWVRAAMILALLIVLIFTIMASIEVSIRAFPRPQSSKEFSFFYRAMQLACGLAITVGFQHGGYYALAGHSVSYATFSDVYRYVIQTFGYMSELASFPETIIIEPFVSISLSAYALSACVTLLSLGCIITAMFGKISFRINSVIRRICEEGAFIQSRLYALYFAVTIALLVVFSFILFTDASPLLSLPQSLGSIAITLIFLCALTSHATAVDDLGRRLGYPLLGLLFCMAVAFSYFNLNDNHAFRTTLLFPLRWEKGTLSPDFDYTMRQMEERGAVLYAGEWTTQTDVHPLPYIESAFLDWIKSRPESARERFKGKPYPIFIVAAEGGGIYAAAQAAAFLARLYDRCPALAHHVFAISGVSGGSVGASVLAAAVGTFHSSTFAYVDRCENSVEHQPGPIEKAALAIIKEDHLAPVVAAGLFPDFFQRFIPYPIPQFDRARALEKSLERSWDQAVSKTHNPLKASFREHWKPSGNAPMLFLNATSLETGEQIVISPVASPQQVGLSRKSSFRSIFQEFAGLPARYDLPLSTAVGLSARFPGISPAGHSEIREGPPEEPNLLVNNTGHFVDGGYVDNSGAETALHIANAISVLTKIEQAGGDNQQPNSSGMDVDIRLIIIGGGADETTWAPVDLTFKELGAPLTAMLKVRSMRANLTIRRATELYPTIQVSLPFEFFQPPLGWKIRTRTVDVIGAMIGVPELCIDLAEVPNEQTLWARLHPPTFEVFVHPSVRQFLAWNWALRQNHCSACRILHLVRGGEMNETDPEPSCTHIPSTSAPKSHGPDQTHVGPP
jgi:hypothetical protein